MEREREMEMKMERERLRDEGETLYVNEAMEFIRAGDQRVRNKLLNIPSRCAPLLLGQKITEVQNILEGVIHEALSELSDVDELPKCRKV